MFFHETLGRQDRGHLSFMGSSAGHERNNPAPLPAEVRSTRTTSPETVPTVPGLNRVL